MTATATCRNCKGSHSSTWAVCPENFKPTPSHPTSLPPPTRYPAKQITNHLLLRKHRTTTVQDPSRAIAIQTPRSEFTINGKIRKRNETRPTERQDASQAPAAQAPRHLTLSQPPSLSPPPRGLKPSSTPIAASASYRDALAPTVVKMKLTLIPIPTTIQDIFFYTSVKFDALERRVGALEEAIGHSFRNPNKRTRSLSARPHHRHASSSRTAQNP
ncbi:hypothetical protein HPB48_021806 [Haemaphysalis longicornis]|uniref:Uncharacterized protein n=1 Tax=Haemaphysalis longicornis TaxID=44386 RepID=A0A9J6GJR1_HAELO|nr:hypothetical protein HPB48_021806 [Haemaphysalis longicornis]